MIIRNLGWKAHNVHGCNLCDNNSTKEEEKEWKYVGVKFLYTNEIKFILIWTKLLEVKMPIAIPRPIPK